MGIVSIAKRTSRSRGLDYYNSKKIINIEKINDNEYKSNAIGTELYNVYLNIEHPRKCTCNCPFANGRRVICKHIIATYFSVVPNSAKEYEEEQRRIEEEYQEYGEYEDEEEYEMDEFELEEYNDYKMDNYESVMAFLNKLSKKELIEEIKLILDLGPSWQYINFINRNIDM